MLSDSHLGSENYKSCFVKQLKKTKHNLHQAGKFHIPVNTRDGEHSLWPNTAHAELHTVEAFILSTPRYSPQRLRDLNRHCSFLLQPNAFHMPGPASPTSCTVTPQLKRLAAPCASIQEVGGFIWTSRGWDQGASSVTSTVPTGLLPIQELLMNSERTHPSVCRFLINYIFM